MEGGFKFQVQRVDEGAVAHRLPGASHCRCHRLVVAGCRGRCSPVQVLTGIEQVREGCTNRQVEEFWAHRKQRAVAKYLSEEPKDCVSRHDDADGNFQSS